MIQVLDHGYVQLCESWGHGGVEGGDMETGIICAARQSTQGSFRGWEKDEKLLQFLYVNRHSTPFEFAGAVIEVQAPIFVFREWQRHRTQSYNEMSARYEPLPDVNYMPSVERLMIGADAGNKQAGTIKGALTLTVEEAELFRERLRCQYLEFERDYDLALQVGIPKEVARCGMPVGRYSRMRASANLRNWLGFLTLRMAPNAQFEIRQYANAVCDLLKPVFPHTMELFRD